MKVEQFDRTILAAIDDDVIKALQPVAEKYGINIAKGRGTFSDNNFTMKIEMSVLGEDGNAVTREATHFTKYAHLYDLDPEWLGKTFRSNGKTFTIVGLNTKAPKYPVLAECNGDGYKFPSERIVALMS